MSIYKTQTTPFGDEEAADQLSTNIVTRLRILNRETEFNLSPFTFNTTACDIAHSIISISPHHHSHRPPFYSFSSGFKDDKFIAQSLRLTLLKSTPTKEAGLTFEDFLRALLLLNAPSSPGAAAALFARYDVHGAGQINAARFSTTMMGLTPSASISPALRTAKNVVNEQLAHRGGAHALRSLHSALVDAVNGSDIIPIRIARLVFTETIGADSRGHVETLLHEAGATLEFEAISARGICEMLRSSLSRHARATLDAVWAQVGGRNAVATTLTVAALAEAPSKSLSLIAGLLTRDFAHTWGSPVSASSDVVTYAEWIDYGRDLRSSAGSDEAVINILSEAFGAVAAYDVVSARAPPGSPQGTVRARRAMMLEAEAATGMPSPGSLLPRRGPAPGPASESTGVPICLNQPLGRYFPSIAYEPMFGKGSSIAVPNGTLLSGITSNGGWAGMSRPAGASFLPGATVGDGVGRDDGATSVSIAQTYTRVRHFKSTSGYLQGNWIKPGSR